VYGVLTQSKEDVMQSHHPPEEAVDWQLVLMGVLLVVAVLFLVANLL
jgi:hypothetical protein